MNDSSRLLNELRIDRTAPAVPERRPLWPWIVLALLVLGGAAAWWAWREPPLEVRVATVQAAPAAAGGGATAASVLDASGYVTARRQATVSSKITGKVIEVLVEEGMEVAEGEVLARLDPVDAQAQRELSASQLAAARSQLDEARTQLALAEKTLARQRDLLARKLVAQSLFDQAQTERDALAARAASAARNVQVAQDALALSGIGVDNTVVRAPFAGVVTVKAAQPGEMISPVSAGGGFTRSGIATIVDMDSLEVQVDVNEAFIGRVQAGQQVEAVLNAYPDWRIPAEVIAIVPTADRAKATVKVRIALKAKDPRIVPEMGVRVSFLEPARAQAAAAAPATPPARVPGEAIVNRDGLQVAFVVVQEHARIRPVTVLRSQGVERDVSQGLVPGEQVILAPPSTLKDGDPVRIAGR